MCGRYYVDDATAREIEKLLRELNRSMQQKKQIEKTGDIYPSDKAFVLTQENHMVTLENMQWGFPGYEGSRLLINARAESVLDKRTFRESVLFRRCVIPARGFYEWNPHKEKFMFECTESEKVLYMAGCYQQFQDGARFVVITTSANASVMPVHHRMPLILEREEVESWIMDSQLVGKYLQKVPPLLYRHTEYEQMTLF